MLKKLIIVLVIAGYAACVRGEWKKTPEITPDDPIFDYDWNFKEGKAIKVLPGYYTFLPWQSAKVSGGARKDNRKRTGIKGVKPDAPLSWTVVSDKDREFIPVMIANSSWKITTPLGSTEAKNSYKKDNRFADESARVKLKAGENKVTAAPLSAGGKGAWFFGLELVDVNDWDKIRGLIKKNRADMSWWSERTYGIFFQWGGWGNAKDGTSKPWPKMIDDFDVERFADMMEEMGAGWVRWSLTWANQQYPGPLKSRDAIARGFTCKRDLVGDLADELDKRNIRLCFYWHRGHSDGKFWKACAPDHTTFLKNYVRQVKEISLKYGTKIWGFGCDDGRGYYPAPYYHLNLAIKAGNPNAVSQFNSWTLPRLHDFQEHYIGEHVANPKWPVNENGIFTKGPHKGLLLGGGFLPEGSGWGTKKGSTWCNPPKMSPEEWVEYLKNIKKNHGAVDPCIRMWENGQIVRKTYEMFVHGRRVFRGISDKQLIAKRKKRGVRNPVACSYTWDDPGTGSGGKGKKRR